MFKIALVGIGDELGKLWDIINHENVIVGKIFSPPTNDLTEVVRKYGINENVTPYIEMPDYLKHEFFDYVLISDTQKVVGKENRVVEEVIDIGYPKDKIIDLTSYNSMEFISLYNVLRYYETHDMEADFFITGVSHAYAGTDMKAFSRLGINLALTSQDLFLDYALARKVLAKKSSNIRYAIIGVAPFSLHYDLSKSVNKHRMLSYYPIVRELHNYHIGENILTGLFNEEYFYGFERGPEELIYPQRLGCNTFDKRIDLEDYLMIRRNLREWDVKCYPETAEENKLILREYIRACIETCVIPILVIYPVSEWYNRCFSDVVFDELRTYLIELSSEYKIRFCDFSNDERFAISDFFDVEHLNIHGARKISSILDELMRA